MCCFCLLRFNILLDDHPKLSDFGFHTPLHKAVGSTSIVLAADVPKVHTCRGYLRPEFCEGKIGPPTDVYA